MSTIKNGNEVVLTGAGILTAAGDTLDQHIDQLINVVKKSNKEDYILEGKIKRQNTDYNPEYKCTYVFIFHFLYLDQQEFLWFPVTPQIFSY